MERKPLLKRLLSCVLAAAVTVNGFVIPTLAEDGKKSSFTKVSNDSVSAQFPGRETVADANETAPYLDTDVVRVSIVLEDKSTLEAGYDTDGIAENASAVSYREVLLRNQDQLISQIERITKKDLDVVWNLTLAANLISANIEYGEIESIEKIDGVKEVVIETLYYPDVLKAPLENDPNMGSSGEQTGAFRAWAEGYTGAGTRIAIVDTGTDIDHQSFSGEGYLYSIGLLAEEAGMSLEDYMDKLNLLTKEEIDRVKDQLNAGNGKYSDHLPSVEAVDSSKAYLNEKLPYAYNYVDGNYDVTHDNDKQGEHGSHVAGIATANAYIKTEDGFKDALDYVNVAGVAPDAQLLTMKVFGTNGGAYDSDYMAAIEDAIVLKADSINLSLGSGNPGRSRSSKEAYQKILDGLTAKGVVVAISAGNAGAWADNAENLTGSLYADDVSMATNGSPGSYTNSLCVASADNIGSSGYYIQVGDDRFVFNENADDIAKGSYKSILTYSEEELEYVYIDGYGLQEEWAALGDALEGKVAVCSRGNLSFFEKANYAVEAGAIATIIYNNTDGIFGMLTDGYKYDKPFIAVSNEAGAMLKANAVKQEAKAAAQSEEETEAAEADVTSDVTDAAETAETSDAADTAEAAETSDAADTDETADTSDTADSEAAETAADTQADNAPSEAAAAVYYAGTLTPYNKFASIISDYPVNQSRISSFSSWGVPGSLEMKPEITAPGGNIYSVNGLPKAGEPGDGTSYENMSGTSMAAPQVAGMAALAAQYIRESKLDVKTGKSPRVLAQSLLMSTAVPLLEEGEESFSYYPVLRQGAGLADISSVVSAESYILMGADATKSYADGKVKAELGDDPDREGEYTFSFSVNNITDTDQSYTLDAALFTQSMYAYYANQDLDIAYYMDTATELLSSSADFVCDGASVDSITVPAGDSKTVEVTLAISAADKAYFDRLIENGLINGTYVEGYVFVDSVGNDEGAVGVSHSIPVLGYYGNWTDPSMFEVGSYIEYKHGLEYRIPYLGNEKVNFFGITYADEPGSIYYFGGNPLIADRTYMPERNSINGDTAISMVSYAAIRNAEQSYFAIFSDVADPLASSMGPVDSAFYHDNQGKWYYTQNTEQIGATPGALGFAEGDSLDVNLILVPEYYIDEEGNAALGMLGEGAYMSAPMTVDNTPPEVTDIVLDDENGVLTVTASDNRYIAAVILYNRTGEVVMAYSPAKETIAEGESADYAIDLTNIRGTEFYIQVADYAMNAVTYRLDEAIGSNDPLPEMIAFNGANGRWVTIGSNGSNKAVAPYTPSSKDFIAATIADHYVFALSGENELYVMPEDDLDNKVKITDIPYPNICDMAYNSADGKIYAVVASSNGSVLLAIDKLTGEAVPSYVIPFTTNTLACDKRGVFYANIYGTDSVAKFVLPDEGVTVEPELLCEEAGIGATKYLQAMEINPNNDKLCWTSVNADQEAYYVEIDTTTGEATVYNDLMLQLYSLIIPDVSAEKNYDFNNDGVVDENDGIALLDLRVGNRTSVYHEENADFDYDGDIDTHDAYLFLNKIMWSRPTDQPTSITLSDSAIKIFRNSTYKLTAALAPWNLTDRSVIWSSSDESVATVSQNGVVTALGTGTCTITAASAADRSVLAECEVTVESVDVTLSGALQDADGDPYLFDWNMEEDSDWTQGPAIKTYILSGAQSPDGYDYIIDPSAGSMYKIDPETGETLAMGEGAKIPLSDFEFSKMFTVDGAPAVFGVYMYLFSTSPNDPMNLVDSFYNLQPYLSQVGSNALIGLASMGKVDFYDSADDATYDAERFVAVDDQGLIWNLFVIEGDLWALGVYDSNMPADFLGSNTDMAYCSLTYGDDGYLYFAVCDNSTSNLYRIEVDDATESCNVSYIGNVGAEVWPAVLFSVSTNASAPAAYTADSFVATAKNEFDVYSENDGAAAYSLREEAPAFVDIKTVRPVVDNVQAAFASAYSAEPMSFAAYSEGNETAATEQISPLSVIDDKYSQLDVKLTAMDNNNVTVDSTNGLFIVKYNPESFRFIDVASPEGVFNAFRVDEEKGDLIIAYASPLETIPAGEAAQTAKLYALGETVSDGEHIDVTHVEVNNKNYAVNADNPGAPVDPGNPGGNIGSAPAEELPVAPTPVTTEGGFGGNDFVDPAVTQPADTSAPADSTDAPAVPDDGGNSESSVTTTAPEATNAPDTTTAPDTTDDNGSGECGVTDSNGPDVSVDDGSGSNVGNDGNGAVPEDKNVNTSVLLCIAPAAISALAVLTSKKRRK